MNNNLLKEINFEIVSLFLKNKNEFLHGRDISRTLKTNQKTTQNTLNLLEKNKLLIKQTKGKNYEFKLNLQNSNTTDLILITEVYKSSKLKTKSFEIKSIIDEIKENCNYPLIIFGSYAKNEETKESDLDVLILSEKKLNFSKISAKYNLKLHFIFQNEKTFKENLLKNNHFQLDILQNHIIISGFEIITNFWINKYGENKMV